MSNYIREIPHVKGMNVTVMGLGLFGGGAAAARYMAREGARVVVTDLRDEKTLARSVDALDGLDIEFHLGGHEEKDFTLCDLLVVSPAVPKESRFLKIAQKAGIPFETETNLFFKLCRGDIIGVTGSNGKTTTAALLYEIMKRSNPRAMLGGNIGRSLLEEAKKIKPKTPVVMELSSFQLEDLSFINQSPKHALLTNVTPNHLDRHGTFDAYVRAKSQVFLDQDEKGITVLNADDPTSADLMHEVKGRLRFFSRKRRVRKGAYLSGRDIVVTGRGTVASRDDVRLPGDFNLENVLAAAAMASALSVEVDDFCSAVRDFHGVAHRLELVGTFDGIRVYNDSIATNPESVIAALAAVDGPKVLLAGGSDKDLDFSALGEAVVKRGVRVVTLGATGPKIAVAVRRAGGEPAAEVDTLAEAVTAGLDLAAEGDALLLSPASASFDQFDNFEHRGEFFKAEVARLTGQKDLSK